MSGGIKTESPPVANDLIPKIEQLRVVDGKACVRNFLGFFIRYNRPMGKLLLFLTRVSFLIYEVYFFL